MIPHEPGLLAAPGLLLGADQWLEGLEGPAWLVDASDWTVRLVNRPALAWLGLGPAQCLGQPAEALLPGLEDQVFWSELRAGHPGQLASDTEVPRPEGLAQVHRRIVPLGAPARAYLVTVQDRSQEARAAAERETLLAELRATLESTADGILVTDLAGRVRAFNRRFAQIWGIPEDLLVDRNDAALAGWMKKSVVDGDAYERRLAALQQATLLATTERLELLSGQVVERVTRPLWSRGRPNGRVYSFRDLTDRLAADQRIEEMALTDALTGLPNRRQLSERVEAAAQRSRHEGRSFALLVVDLDRFRQVNDTLGHEVGDRVLLDVSGRIQGCLRAADVLARIDGDQFALLVHDADAAAAEARSEEHTSELQSH